MYNVIKNILFNLDAEDAHDLIIALMHRYPLISSFPFCFENNLTQNFDLNVGRKKWTFPVGLAAGLDKNGFCYPFFSSIGFGAVEVGTVTPLAQEGNRKPRLFRLKKEESIRNCMGFNNRGSDQLLVNLQRLKNKSTPIGVNIGKNKTTDDNIAYKDYHLLYHKFKNSCDYVVINISSPNTPGLRSHQGSHALSSLLSQIDYDEQTDLFVKISPDIAHDDVWRICDIVKKFNLTGVIATNTTVMESLGEGGVSGKLLFEKSRLIRNLCIDALAEDSQRYLIGVGGFSDFSEIKDFWKRGGRALQIYSSFIYQGPAILNKIRSSLISDFSYYGVSSMDEYLQILKEQK